MQQPKQAAPQPVLSVFDAVTIMVGLVVGIGIFRTPSLVANNVGTEWMFLMVWILGGFITLIGALCYAELSAAHPDAGGEYHFLSNAYGKRVALMFGWARCTVIQTGAIAAVAFVFGDYANQLYSLGDNGPAIYAASSTLVIAAVNIVGTLQTKWLQILVTGIEIVALAAIVLLGIFSAPEAVAAPAPSTPPETAALGLAMVFVLLTYGGWNETAYLSGELKDPQRNMARVLIMGTVILVLVYVAVNYALLSVLGLDGIRSSNAVAADMMQRVVGPWGGTLVSVAIVIAAISTLNATAFTGARVFYSMANDLRIGGWMGAWNSNGKTPANAQIVQCVWALALIGFGAGYPDGFAAMVNYTAPVFWGFMLLVAISLFVLRKRWPNHVRPYKVPLYPVTPVLFTLFCGYMLYSSVMYAGKAGWIGLAVLAAGLPVLLLRKTQSTKQSVSEQAT